MAWRRHIRVAVRKCGVIGVRLAGLLLRCAAD